MSCENCGNYNFPENHKKCEDCQKKMEKDKPIILERDKPIEKWKRINQ